MALLSAAVLVGLLAQPGAAVNVPQSVVVSTNPADWTPHVLDGKVTAIVQIGNKIVAGGQFTKVASAAAPMTAIARSNIFAFDATTGAIDTAFAPVLDAQVEGLAAVDPVTGALSADLNLAFTGPRNGTVNIDKFDITPDGSRLIAIGNWTYVAGLQRDQIVMLNLATSPVTVTDWGDQPLPAAVRQVFDTYMRDVDISPDGSYFVVGTTGAYRAGSLCDSAARWETGAAGTGQQPTWVDYTGGDTLYSVAITGTAVYLGGHQRWMNNSFAADKAGPGAVAREGIAALDPVNGPAPVLEPGP